MIDNDEFFVGNAGDVDDSHAKRAAGALRTCSRRSVKGSSRIAGGSLGAWRTSVSVSRHNMNHENFPNWRLMTIILIHSSSNRSLWRGLPGRLVCHVERVALEGSHGHLQIPPHLFSFVCVLPLLLWRQIPPLANLSIFSCLTPLREAQCRSMFTKQKVAVVTRDVRAHYNLCTYLGMLIKLFLIRIWPPSPLFVGNTDLNKFRKLRTTRPWQKNIVKLQFKAFHKARKIRV